MQLQEVLAKLEAVGTEQACRTYKRHGVKPPMFGVSYAELGKLVKAIKTDHALAEGLWKSGVHDARILATMVADPKALTASTVDAWSKALGNYVLTDAFAKLVLKTKFAEEKAVVWAASTDEWLGAAGWVLVNGLALENRALPDAFFVKYVKEAKAKIHGSKNRVRHAMLTALIGIGLRNAKLEELALTAAEEIGDVEIDHGETSCETPSVSAYIAKTKAHRGRVKAKK